MFYADNFVGYNSMLHRIFDRIHKHISKLMRVPETKMTCLRQELQPTTYIYLAFGTNQTHLFCLRFYQIHCTVLYVLNLHLDKISLKIKRFF